MMGWGTKMKDSTILKKAKKYIKNGRSFYVCHAVCLAQSGGRVSAGKCPLTQWIQSMLGTHYTYHGWLLERGHDTSFQSVKAGQLAWLDWMIAYCEKEETK